MMLSGAAQLSSANTEGEGPAGATRGDMDVFSNFFFTTLRHENVGKTCRRTMNSSVESKFLHFSPELIHIHREKNRRSITSEHHI